MQNFTKRVWAYGISIIFIGILALVGGVALRRGTLTTWAKTSIIADLPRAGENDHSGSRREYIVDLRYEADGISYTKRVTALAKPEARVLVRYSPVHPEAATIDSPGLIVVGILGIITGIGALLSWTIWRGKNR